MDGVKSGLAQTKALAKISTSARTTLVASLLLPALATAAGSFDYDDFFALRSSSGFRAALQAAELRLKAFPADAAAAGVRALVLANGVDYLAMPPHDAKLQREAALATAVQLDKDDPWIDAAIGLAHMADDPSLAEQRLSQCIADYPAFLECYNLYGDLLRKTGRTEDAGAIYRRALERWPSDGELRISYALYLQESQQVAAARRQLEELVKDQPDFPRAHWHLAVLLHETNADRSAAIAAARRALELDPLIWNGQKLLELLDADER